MPFRQEKSYNYFMDGKKLLKLLKRLKAIGVQKADIARAAGISKQAFYELLERKRYDKAADHTRRGLTYMVGELEEINHILGELEE